MPAERQPRRNRQKRRKQQTVNMVVVDRAINLAVYPVISKDFHKFKKFIFKLQKAFVHSLRFTRRTRRVHHHLGLRLVELAELERRAFIIYALTLRAFPRKHILNQSRGHFVCIQNSASKRFIRYKPIFRLLDFLDKRFLAVRRHKRLAPALEHRQKRDRKVIRILAMQNPGCIFTRFQIIANLGDIAYKIAPSLKSRNIRGNILSVRSIYTRTKTDKRPIRARIQFQITNRNIRLHFILHHFSNQIFRNENYTD